MLYFSLIKERVSFRFDGESIGVRDKQIVCSGDLFAPHSHSFPLNPEKKTLIPYISDVSIKDPFQNSQRKFINSNQIKFLLFTDTLNLI